MQSDQCDVLITYSWNRVGYNILRSLTEHGLKVWAADTSKCNICSVSKFCAGTFQYPDPFAKEDDFISVLKSKVLELHPKVLLPTHDEALIILKHKNVFPDDLIIPYPDYQTVLKLSNKAAATKIANAVGVPIPKIYKSIAEVESYPVVLKKVMGNSAKGVFFPKNKDELIRLTRQLGNEDVLLEEWVGGSDYSVDCIRWGSFYQGSVYHALITKTKGGGTTTQREIVSFPELVEFAKIILEEVDYNGVCGMDFRYDPLSKSVAFIEVNARYTGGLATPIAANFDIPWIHYCLATCGKYEQPIKIKIGTKTKWILGDIISLVDRLLHLKLNRKELGQICRFRGFDVYDDYRNDDKKAILGEMMYYLGKLIKNRKLNP